MAFKIFLRRFVALLLCCVLVGSSFARSAFATDPVTAASLAITGGQLAGAGLSGEAALSLAGPVGAVIGVTLGALGVNAYVSNAAQEAGKTRTRFVLDKLVIWGAQAGYTQEQLYSKIAQGISVAADGTIQLGQDVAKTIEQFGNWLFTQEGEVVETAPVDSLQYFLGQYPVGTVENKTYYWRDTTTTDYTIVSGVSSDVPVYEFYTNRSNAMCFFSTAPTSFTFIYESPSQGTRSGSVSISTKAGDLYYGINTEIGWSGEYTISINYNDTSAMQDLFSNGLTSTGEAAQDVFVGTEQDWTDNRDVLNPSIDDSSVVLNPDLLNPILDSLADGTQATMSIIDYLQALQDAWDHALDDVNTSIGTITDSLTGIQEQIAVPQDAVKNPTVTNPSVTPETTPVLDPSTVDPGTAVTGLSFDLTQIFPFCIPFDIYDMLATLSATPEAPVYHVHYEGPYNILIDFTVDLSPWDSVAAVLRTVELLAFCIGLAYVTRSMFIRS